MKNRRDKELIDLAWRRFRACEWADAQQREAERGQLEIKPQGSYISPYLIITPHDREFLKSLGVRVD